MFKFYNINIFSESKLNYIEKIIYIYIYIYKNYHVVTITFQIITRRIYNNYPILKYILI